MIDVVRMCFYSPPRKFKIINDTVDNILAATSRGSTNQHGDLFREGVGTNPSKEQNHDG